MNRRLWAAYVRAANFKERTLRALMPGRMPIVSYSWPLKAEVCPCDVHFCDYLKARRISGRSIFHFGTGGHHLVGHENRNAGLHNDILGITASPGEHARYVAEVVRDPLLGRHYKVLFADIYHLRAASLPMFDLVTLFHLCEFSDAVRTIGRLDDAGVLDLFLSRLSTDGRLLFYAGSFAEERASALIARAVDAGRMAPLESFKSLRVFRAVR